MFEITILDKSLNITNLRLQPRGQWFIQTHLSLDHACGKPADNIHDDVIKWKHFPRYWPFLRQSIGHRRIPFTMAIDAELCCFLWFAPEQTVEQTLDTPVIWDAIALIMMSL